MVLGVSGTANAGKKNKYYGAGVSSKNNSYIGVNKAIAIALKKVPGANQSHVYDVHLDREMEEWYTKGKSTTMVGNMSLT